jgi:ankyrin repeat protein
VPRKKIGRPVHLSSYHGGATEGADIDVGGLQEAARDGNVQMVQNILAQGASVDGKDGDPEFRRTALITAAANNRTNVIPVLLNYGASISATDGQGWTASHNAARFWEYGAAQTPLQSGASVHAKVWNTGETPLHQAAACDHEQIVQLLQNNANIDAKTQNGETPLDKAKESGHRSMVKFLISRGAYDNGSKIQDNYADDYGDDDDY